MGRQEYLRSLLPDPLSALLQSQKEKQHLSNDLLNAENNGFARKLFRSGRLMAQAQASDPQNPPSLVGQLFRQEEF